MVSSIALFPLNAGRRDWLRVFENLIFAIQCRL
jgi:hypothetical protein